MPYTRGSSRTASRNSRGFSNLVGDAPEWQELSLCRQTDPEVFFPANGSSTEAAKKICKRCPVKDDCLEWAENHDEKFGVWGGKDMAEQNALKKKTLKKVTAHERAAQVIAAGEKPCPRCRVTKPLTGFALNRKALDGHSTTCKPCRAELEQRTKQSRRLGLPVKRAERVRGNALVA